jgi:antitoxin ParD1/3/4
MPNITVNLSDDLQQFVDVQIRTGRFEGAEKYIESLVRRAKRGSESIESLLLEGLNSGDPVPLDADAWDSIRSEVADQIGRSSV